MCTVYTVHKAFGTRKGNQYNHYINLTSLNCRRMLGFDQKLRETKDTVMGEVDKRKMTIMMILMMMIIMIIVINVIMITIL